MLCDKHLLKCYSDINLIINSYERDKKYHHCYTKIIWFSMQVVLFNCEECYVVELLKSFSDLIKSYAQDKKYIAVIQRLLDFEMQAVFF